MKNINVKKVVAGAAALALGVGVLGVAIAGNNNGTAFGSVAKTDVYNTADMSPKVTLVTGTVGDDDAWAQNIANAIASNAKRENPLYASWVPSDGETTTTTGEGKEFKKNEIGDDFADLKLDYKDYPALGDYKVKVNNTKFGTTEIKVKDFLLVSGNVAFDPDEDVKDLTTTIESQQLKYQVTFTPGIKDGADDTGSPDFKFEIMGKEYTLEEWDGTSKELTLVQNKATTPYSEGDSFTADNYTIEVVNILDSGAENEYEVELRLKDASGTVKSTDIFVAGDEIFSDYLDVTVEISKVYSNRVAVVAGTSAKLTLKDGDLIEDFPESEDELWAVDMEVVDKALISITIYNDDPDVEWKNENALKIGDSASYPFDFAKVKFEGLTEEDSKAVTVEDGYINYTDADDEDHEIFFYDYASWSNGVERYTTRKTIDDKKLYFDFNTTSGKFTIQETNSDGEYLDHDGTWGTLHEYDIPDNNTIDFNVGLWNNEEELVTYTIYTDSNTSIKKIAVGLKKGATGTINDLDKDHTWEIGDIYDSVDVDNHKTGIMIGDNDDGFATAALKSMFEFIVSDDTEGAFTAHIDAYTGNLVNTSSTKYKAGLVQVTSEDFYDLDQEETDDLRWAYTDWGTKYEVDGGKFTATIPEEQLYAKIFIGAGTVTTGGTEENPYDEYIMTPVTVSDLLKKDSMAATGTLIVVGGHLANTVADGITNTFLAQTGDYIVGKYSNGNIYVAGWTKADTGTAAGELVTTINGW
ncbi:MAG TPA: hypothetical protein PLK55_03715 [archaeon]|nr:hypothetical protein [archaeon]